MARDVLAAYGEAARQQVPAPDDALTDRPEELHGVVVARAQRVGEQRRSLLRRQDREAVGVLPPRPGRAVRDLRLGDDVDARPLDHSP